jgi:hypothetical protein
VPAVVIVRCDTLARIHESLQALPDCPSRTETMWPPFLAMPGTPHAQHNERALLGAFCLFAVLSARDSDATRPTTVRTIQSSPAPHNGRSSGD